MTQARYRSPGEKGGFGSDDLTNKTIPDFIYHKNYNGYNFFVARVPMSDDYILSFSDPSLWGLQMRLTTVEFSELVLALRVAETVA